MILPVQKLFVATSNSSNPTYTLKPLPISWNGPVSAIFDPCPDCATTWFPYKSCCLAMTDWLAGADEFQDEFLLIVLKLRRPPERNSASHGRLSSFLRSCQDQGPLELGDAAEDGHDHLSGRTG